MAAVSETTSRIESVSSTAHDKINKASSAVHPAVDRVADTAHGVVDKLASVASNTADSLDTKTEQLKTAQAQLADAARNYLNQKPLVSLGIAVGAGFLLSRLLSRD